MIVLPHEGGPGWGYILDAATDGATLIAVGDDEDTDGRGASIWVSDDGTTWTRTSPTALRGTLEYDAISAEATHDAGNHWVVLGSAWDSPDEIAVALMWIGWPEGAERFIDVLVGNEFLGDVEWATDEGIARGCNPPANTRFCHDDPVSRGQMAALLVRALGYTDDGGGDLFVDDDDFVFETDIDKLGTARFTRGCNPPDNDRYCPDDSVTRGQMAALLVRALDG